MDQNSVTFQNVQNESSPSLDYGAFGGAPIGRGRGGSGGEFGDNSGAAQRMSAIDTMSNMQSHYSAPIASIPVTGGGIDGSQPERANILLAVTGSVASIKLPELVLTLTKFAEVKVVTTEKAKSFYRKESLPNSVNIYDDQEDWSEWTQVGDPILHIELRKWADLLLIAPLSANTLSKMACGQCDNLVTCIVRAWDYNKPLLVAPAMNTHMWNNPFTGDHLSMLRTLGVQVITPVHKKLACGDTGLGGMAASDTIAYACQVALGLHIGILLKRERTARKRALPLSMLMVGLFLAIGVTFSGASGSNSYLANHEFSKKVSKGIKGGLRSIGAFFARHQRMLEDDVDKIENDTEKNDTTRATKTNEAVPE